MSNSNSKIKGNKILLAIIILIILLFLFIVKYFIGSSSGNNVTIIDRLLGDTYDISVNKKEFGTADLKKDDRGNFYIYLNTGMEKLDSAIEKIVNDYRTNATTYETYSIDCTSRVLFNNIYEVKYMLLEDKKPNAEVAKSINVYYSKSTDEIINYTNILRDYYKSISKYRYNDELDFNDVDMKTFVINNDEVTFGKGDKKLSINYEKYKLLFKSEIGIPSIYSGEVYKPKIMPIDPNKKHIAFTFDDGPANQNHVRIREIFDKYNQQATFFFVGQMAIQNPNMVLDSYKKGHMICSHSWTHPDLVRLTPEQQAKEILDTDDELFKITGHDINYLRPPYGSFNQSVKEIVNDKIALWSVDSLDWKSRDTNAIINEVRPYIADGAVVLFHDLYDATANAIEILVPELIQQGYQFVRYDVLEDYMNKKGNN